MFLRVMHLFQTKAYSDAVSQAQGEKEEALARSNRAAAYLKVNKYTEALQDSAAAAKIRPTEIAFYRKG